MKKLISISLICIFSLSVFAFNVSATEISAECACVMSCSTGEVLYNKNMNIRHTMASTTKIMTAVLAIESGKLAESVTVGDEILTVEGTSFGLEKGDTTSLYNLVFGMMLSSGNDVANSVAEFVGGSIPAFVDMMNQKASEIGMNSTSFATPSGLDADNHYTTAYDMALLAKYAINVDSLKTIVSSKSCSVCFDSGKTLYAQNHNKLLTKCDGCNGIKTGFTKKSGRCLVSSCERNFVELVAVTLNAPDDWNDHIKMFDEAYNKINEYKIPTNEEYIDVVGGVQNTAIAICPYPLSYYSSTEQNSAEVIITHNPFLYAPLEKGSVVGKATLYVNNNKVSEQPLLLEETIEQSQVQHKKTLAERIRNTIFRWIEKWKN